MLATPVRVLKFRPWIEPLPTIVLLVVVLRFERPVIVCWVDT